MMPVWGLSRLLLDAGAMASWPVEVTTARSRWSRSRPPWVSTRPNILAERAGVTRPGRAGPVARLSR